MMSPIMFFHGIPCLRSLVAQLTLKEETIHVRLNVEEVIRFVCGSFLAYFAGVDTVDLC